VSSDATEREVPTGAIVTALAMTEALSHRQGAPLEEFAAAIAGAIQQWGHDTIIDGFSMLLGVGMSYLSHLQFEDEPTRADERPTLRVVLPALLIRLERALAADPNFSAIEQIASHSESYSPACSRTKPTARYRTSTGCLDVPATTPSSSSNGASIRLGAVHTNLSDQYT
jgi:hypothetical protein